MKEKTYIALKNQFEGFIVPGVVPSASYDQSYGENFYVEMVEGDRVFKFNVILSYVHPTKEETVENYDLRYLSVLFSAGLPVL